MISVYPGKHCIKLVTDMSGEEHSLHVIYHAAANKVRCIRKKVIFVGPPKLKFSEDPKEYQRRNYIAKKQKLDPTWEPKSSFKKYRGKAFSKRVSEMTDEEYEQHRMYCADLSADYRKRSPNPDKLMKKYRDNLADSYVKAQLVGMFPGSKRSDFTPGIIEAKRQQLKLRRMANA